MSKVSPEELVPTSEVAARLGVTPKTVARWAAEGRITPAIKAPGLRGAMLFRVDDLDALLGGQQ